MCTRIGDSVIDLSVVFEHGLLVGDKNVFKSASLNEFISQGKDYWHAIRVQIQKVFTKGTQELMDPAFKDHYLFSH